MLCEDLSASSHYLIRTGFPQHSGPQFWVLKLFNKRGDIFLISSWTERVDYCRKKRQVFNPLSRPICTYFSRWNSPHLFGVSLEEDPIKTPAKACSRPSLKTALILWWSNSNTNVRQHTSNCLKKSKVSQCIARFKRVIKKLFIVVNSTHSRSEHKVVVRKYFVPDFFDTSNFCKKTMPTYVKSPAVLLNSS